MGKQDQEARERRERRRIVREYLLSIEQARAVETGVSAALATRYAAKVADLQERIAAETAPLRRLELVQQRRDLERRLSDQAQLAAREARHDALEDEIAEPLGIWAAEQGIGWRALRTVGVPFRVLRAAGIEATT